MSLSVRRKGKRGKVSRFDRSEPAQFRELRRVDRRHAQRPLDYGGNLVVVDGSRAATAGLVEQAITAILQKPAAPLANGVLVDTKFGSDGLAWQAEISRPSDPSSKIMNVFSRGILLWHG
jgi:hypothetical protein